MKFQSYNYWGTSTDKKELELVHRLSNGNLHKITKNIEFK